MMTYSKASKASIDRAVEKAKQVKPRVRPLEFGKFQVSSSRGGSYEVTFSKQNGEFAAVCGCKANQNGQVCYHTVAASGVFKLQVNQRAASAACEIDDCGQEVAGKGLCQEHLNIFEELRATSPAGKTACLMDDCGMPAADKGFCQTHLNEFETILAETTHPFQDLLDAAGSPCVKCHKPAAKLVNELCPVCEAELCIFG